MHPARGASSVGVREDGQQAETLVDLLDDWLEIVQPVHEAYQRARRYAQEMRRLNRKGLATAAEAEQTERRRDELLAEYRDAIRRADQEV